MLRLLRIAAIALLALFLVTVATCVYLSWPYDLPGPDSPTGCKVVVHVHDCGVGWSCDFYADVEVLDPQGNVAARWRDEGGQYPSDGPEHLVKSMRWVDATTLEFTTRSGAVRLTVPE